MAVLKYHTLKQHVTTKNYLKLPDISGPLAIKIPSETIAANSSVAKALAYW